MTAGVEAGGRRGWSNTPASKEAGYRGPGADCVAYLSI